MFNFLSFLKTPWVLKLVEVSDSQPKPALEYSEGVMCLYKNQSQLAGFSLSQRQEGQNSDNTKTQPLSNANTPNSTIPASCTQFQEFSLAKLISVNCPKGKNLPETFSSVKHSCKETQVSLRNGECHYVVFRERTWKT